MNSKQPRARSHGGIRNIKLVFSRKLLYASGLFSVGLTANRPREDKIRVLQQLLDLPVIDRIVEICGEQRADRVLNAYDYFLGKLEDPAVRERLETLKSDERNDPVFRDLKDAGHRFTHELLALFESTFDQTHPIRRAVIF